MSRLTRHIAAVAAVAMAVGTAAVVVSATSTGNTGPGSVTLMPADTCAKPAPSFAKDIKPLADVRCKGCHAAKMSDYNNIISKKLVVPNKPDESKYYMKPSGKASHGGGNVWKDKADLIKAWIASGAAK